MKVLDNTFTTIRISKTLKNRLNKISSKGETYNDILEKLLNESQTAQIVENTIIDELKKKKYIEFGDIKW